MSTLTYYLVKSEIKDLRELKNELDGVANFKQLSLKSTTLVSSEMSVVAYAKVTESSPRSIQFLKDNFQGLSVLGDLTIRRPSLLLVFTYDSRMILVSMGDAFHLIPYNILEPGFGKELGLRWIESDQINLLASQRTGKNPSRIEQALTLPGGVDNFQPLGFDAMLDAIGGKVKSNRGWSNFVGGHTVKYKFDPNLTVVANCAKEIYIEYKNRISSADKIEGLDDLSRISSNDRREYLYKCLHEKILLDNAENLSLSIPYYKMGENDRLVLRYRTVESVAQFAEPIEISRFHEESVVKIINDHLSNFDRFYSIRTSIALQSPDPDHVGKYKYKGSEQFIDNLSFMGQLDTTHDVYFLHEGQWYEIRESLVDKVNKEFEAIFKEDGRLPLFVKHSNYTENDYNAEVPGLPGYEEWACLDKAKLQVAVGNSKHKIECCDLITPQLEFLHVKIGWGSSLVSTVTRQSIDASICYRRWPEMWNTMQSEAPYLAMVDPVGDESKICVCIALILLPNQQWSEMPIKSKLAIIAAKKEIRGIGYNFKLMRTNREYIFD